MIHEVFEHALFERARIFHPDHNLRQLVFENPRRREIVGRRDFTQVRHHCVGAFGAVYAEARPIGLTDREDEVTNPCHRQIGQNRVCLTQAIEFRRRFGRFDDVAVGQNNALGLTGCARGVQHHAGGVVIQRGDATFQFRAKCTTCSTARCDNIVVFVQRAVIIFP